ncbi:MAG TPA: arginine--tRNA ligase [Ktedonobacterales bacterium]|nr:arginine--tRNA ligase [Ktedonobacterales bacterium]
MIRDSIRELTMQAALAAQQEGTLPQVDLPSFDVERPQYVTHGDFAANLAMKLAGEIKRTSGEKANPRQLGEAIAAQARKLAGEDLAFNLVETVEVAGAGFINYRLSPAWLLQQADRVLEEGDDFGVVDVGLGERVNLEFVSANPTGQVHVGNGRGAFIGDTLGNVMQAAGYNVTKEYYFNDFGQQIFNLGRSIEYFLRQAIGAPAIEKIENGYYDDYYARLAEQFVPDAQRYLALPQDERDAELGSAAAKIIMLGIHQTMERLGINFDVWFSQHSLDTSGALQESIELLRKKGYLYEQDGATWMRTTDFGDDKDRVIIKSTGEPTYIAPDVAYIKNKFERGFDKLIWVLGPDHHGYVSRLKAAAGMLDYDPDHAIVLLYGNVTVQGKRIGKRLGNAIPLDDLVDEIGKDVTRYFFLMRSNEQLLDFDMELAREQSEKNPGLYVQYAHARIASIFRKASERLHLEEHDYTGADMRPLADDPAPQRDVELALMREMLSLEEVIERISLTLEPHHLTKYATDLATAFHSFYHECRVLQAEDEATRLARLKLSRAAQIALARALHLMGLAAPERMVRETDGETEEAGAEA